MTTPNTTAPKPAQEERCPDLLDDLAAIVATLHVTGRELMHRDRLLRIGKAIAAHDRLEAAGTVARAALALADRLNQDDRCDEEQEELCRVVEDYRAKGGA